MAGNSDTAVPTEKAVVTYVSSLSALGASSFPGFVERPAFSYKDTDEIYISPGAYNHNGTAEQIVYWDAQITFKFGSGGSNASSTDLAASDWFYLYIDDSAVVTLGAAELTASEFVAVTTAPTYSVAKHGWYSGSDRCIGAFLTNSSSNLIDFEHDGGDLFLYSTAIQDRSETSVATTKDITVTAPAFCSKILFTLRALYSSANTSIFWTEYGGTDQDNFVCRVYSTATDLTSQISIPVDSTPGFTVVVSNSGASIRGWTNGYYFPKGM
jgi:hypothetical protein